MTDQAYQTGQQVVFRTADEQPKDAPRKDVAVHSTSRYGRFRFSSANRPIDPGHLARLYDAVAKKNLLHRYPILVSEEGIVIDGQHRLKVAEALGVSIFYQVADDMDVGDMADINAVHRSWTLEDYLNFWCDLGSEDYLRCRDFMRKVKWMPLRFVANLNYEVEVTGDTVTAQFKEGHMRFRHVDRCAHIAKMALEFKPSLGRHYKTTAFLYAVAHLLDTPGYSQATMLKKLEYQSTRLVPCLKTADYLSLLHDIYNHRRKLDNYVDIAGYRNRAAARSAATKRAASR